MNNIIYERKIKPINETSNRITISRDDFEYLLICQKRTEQIRKNQRNWDKYGRKYSIDKRKLK